MNYDTVTKSFIDLGHQLVELMRAEKEANPHKHAAIAMLGADLCGLGYRLNAIDTLQLHNGTKQDELNLATELATHYAMLRDCRNQIRAGYVLRGDGTDNRSFGAIITCLLGPKEMERIEE